MTISIPLDLQNLTQLPKNHSLNTAEKKEELESLSFMGPWKWFVVYLNVPPTEKNSSNHKGKQWMSIVFVEELAKYVWKAVVEEKEFYTPNSLMLQAESLRNSAEVTSNCEKHGRLKMVDGMSKCANQFSPLSGWMTVLIMNQRIRG